MLVMRGAFGAWLHLPGRLVVEKLGHVFGRRIDGVEGRLIVQEFVVHAADQVSQDVFQVSEIDTAGRWNRAAGPSTVTRTR